MQKLLFSSHNWISKSIDIHMGLVCEREYEHRIWPQHIPPPAPPPNSTSMSHFGWTMDSFWICWECNLHPTAHFSCIQWLQRSPRLLVVYSAYGQHHYHVTSSCWAISIHMEVCCHPNIRLESLTCINCWSWFASNGWVASWRNKRSKP
jgi:hypothetical protein